MAWYDDLANAGTLGLYGDVTGRGSLSGLFSTGADQVNQQRAQYLTGAGQQAQQFGDTSGRNFQGQDTFNLTGQRQYLQGLASGQNSVSAEQLRQGLQQNLAAQRSLAASASPQNQAMAARLAAMNSARMGYGMAGQQALAGLQERNDANAALAQMNLQQRQQDLQAALGGQSNAISAFGNQAPQSAGTDMMMGLLGGAAGGAMGAMTKSDRRAKTAIASGDKAANAATSKLSAQSFRYKKPERDGKGKQLGVMAQDLEKAGLKHAVVNTPQGKAIHGGKLATANTAMIAALGKRVSKLEKGKSASY